MPTPSSSFFVMFPIIPGSVCLPCANSSLSLVFTPFRYLQDIIMYPLSQAAHINFFSSFLINQSLNPSKPFNHTSSSSLNSIQFLQVSDNVTRGWMQGSSCCLTQLRNIKELNACTCTQTHKHAHLGGWTPCLASCQHHPSCSHIIMK